MLGVSGVSSGSSPLSPSSFQFSITLPFISQSEARLKKSFHHSIFIAKLSLSISHFKKKYVFIKSFSSIIVIQEFVEPDRVIVVLLSSYDVALTSIVRLKSSSLYNTFQVKLLSLSPNFKYSSKLTLISQLNHPVIFIIQVQDISTIKSISLVVQVSVNIFSPPL
ncbi:MAG: hypothetical protein LBF15_02455 [Candidatus Peribacteria bacterium]|nr:hypothetical protein [Candidatus Peribacteria bacterium]